MHILIIPSWYPFQGNPYSGIFIQEQARALGTMMPEDQISLSLWGQKEFNLQMRRPLQALRTTQAFLRTKPYKKLLSANVTEYYTPCLSWYYPFWGGNLNRVLKINFRNLEMIEADYGKVNLIHAHASYPAGSAACYLSKTLNIPYIITEHMSPHSFSYYTRNGQLMPLVSEPLMQANRLITVSPVVDAFLQKHQLPKSEVIPNCIDETVFKPARSVSKEQPFTFFTAARITGQKGIDELLQAAKQLLNTFSETRFRIAGHGSHLQTFQALSTKLGISAAVKWLGPLNRDALLMEYQNCNCFVLPSYSETFGMVYIEAMACGKPVIATRCGGPEFFVNQENGILVEKKDVSSLINGMSEMVREGKARFSSDQIRNYFLTHFSKKAVIPKIIAVYQAL